MALDKKMTFPKNLKEFGYGFDEGTHIFILLCSLRIKGPFTRDSARNEFIEAAGWLCVFLIRGKQINLIQSAVTFDKFCAIFQNVYFLEK